VIWKSIPNKGISKIGKVYFMKAAGSPEDTKVKEVKETKKWAIGIHKNKAGKVIGYEVKLKKPPKIEVVGSALFFGYNPEVNYKTFTETVINDIKVLEYDNEDILIVFISPLKFSRHRRRGQSPKPR